MNENENEKKKERGTVDNFDAFLYCSSSHEAYKAVCKLTLI